MNITIKSFSLVMTLGAGLALGCSGSGSEPGDCRSRSTDDTLGCLGVGADDTPRRDERGDGLPDDYSPLGSSFETGQSAEFLFVGMQLSPLENRGAFVELSDDDSGLVGPAITDSVELGTLWESDNHSPHTSSGASSAGLRATRAVVAVDLDGDGKDSMIAVFLDPDDPASAGAVYFEIVGAGQARTLAGLLDGVVDVSAEAGDFDGDGLEELAIGVASRTGAELWWLSRDQAGELSVSSTTAIDQTIDGSEMSLELAAGNLDRDNGHELVAVANEYRSDSGNITAVARYFVYDDARADHTVLADSQIVGAGPRAALLSDVAIGDIDADGKGEIVFAGLAEMSNDSCDSLEHVYLAIDDAGDTAVPLGVIGESTSRVNYIAPGTGCNSNSHLLQARFVHVNAFDVDGDGVDEIQANLRVFEDFDSAAPFTELFSIPATELLPPNQTSGGTISQATTSMTVADIDGNGREELINFFQWRDEVSVWGLDGPSLDNAVWREVTRIDTATYNSQSRVFPIIVAGNMDSDGVALKYSEAEYRLVFTEPVIMAALAAAPCADNIGQNTGACTTAYGQSQGTSTGLDGTVTVSAKTFVSFEAKDPFFGIGVEGSSSVTTTASLSAGISYNLEETIEYTTGAIEDTVVFTTIPLDQYTYTIVSHPDASLVGTQVVVNLPRTPVTLQVEREFYNASVEDGAFKVDASVLSHTAGNIDSYVDEAAADALIARHGGLKSSRAVTVGQGTGQVSTEIAFSTETTYRAGLDVSYEAEIAVSGGGVSVGAGVGGSVGAGISWGSSSSTVYRGTLGNLSADTFADNFYSAGLFTYIHNAGNRGAPQFEVINYWVER